MTQKLYLDDTYQYHFEAQVDKVSEDERGVYVILDRSAFYPQGGGQPSDQGKIQCHGCDVDIIRVLLVANEIRHYVSVLPEQVSMGMLVQGSIDPTRRMLNARYHTAAHLLGNAVEVLTETQKAVKGHSFPGEAYVGFQGEGGVDALALQTVINDAIVRGDQVAAFEIDPLSFERQFYALPYQIPEKKTFRAVQIGGFLPGPPHHLIIYQSIAWRF